jgi:hypothetical protein
MGYMTIVCILNDAWPTIKENKNQFIANIEEGMENYHGGVVKSYPVGNYANPMEVHRSFHANLNRVLVVGGNHMEDITATNPMRTNDDFYLAYKMRTIRCAEDMAKSAKIEIIDMTADMIVADMRKNTKDFDQIKETAEKYDSYKAMTEDEQNRLVWTIRSKLSQA